MSHLCAEYETAALLQLLKKQARGVLARREELNERFNRLLKYVAAANVCVLPTMLY